MAQRITHLDTARTRLADLSTRMCQAGFLPADVIMTLRSGEGAYWIEFSKNGEMIRTTSVIGHTPRDVARWVHGYSTAVFAITFVTLIGADSIVAP